VDVPVSELDQLQKVRGSDFELRAGMPVSLQIPLRKRTALQYMFEPMTGAVRKSISRTLIRETH
jgi:HlyD family secretion protein